MSYMGKHPGAAPVGAMEELPRLEASIILYLRLWCDSPEGQTDVWRDFHSFYDAQAKAHMADFEALMITVMKYARRPLQRHQVQCSCVGGDENAFANFVVAAALGEREDAVLLASNFMRVDMALVATSMAEKVGLSLSRMVMPTPLGHKFSHNVSNTKH